MKNEQAQSSEYKQHIWIVIALNILSGMPMIWVVLFYGFVAAIQKNPGFPNLDRYHIQECSWLQNILVIFPFFCAVSVFVAIFLHLALTVALRIRVRLWFGYSALVAAILAVFLDFRGWISWFFTYSQ